MLCYQLTELYIKFNNEKVKIVYTLYESDISLSYGKMKKKVENYMDILNDLPIMLTACQ